MIGRLPTFVLALFSAINVARGSIHSFAPDGGALSIAGLDLGNQSTTIVALFASIGLMQLSLGLFELWVVARNRALVVPVLCLQTLNTCLGVIHLYIYRPLPVIVPGAAFNLGLLAILTLTWILYLSRNRT